LKFDLAIEKLKSHKSAGINHTPAVFFKAGGWTICSEVRKLFISIWNKQKLPEE